MFHCSPWCPRQSQDDPKFSHRDAFSLHWNTSIILSIIHLIGKSNNYHEKTYENGKSNRISRSCQIEDIFKIRFLIDLLSQNLKIYMNYSASTTADSVRNLLFCRQIPSLSVNCIVKVVCCDWVSNSNRVSILRKIWEKLSKCFKWSYGYGGNVFFHETRVEFKVLRIF